MRRPKRVLMTVLVANTTVNVLLFATSYVAFSSLARQVGAWVTPVAGLASVLLVMSAQRSCPKCSACAWQTAWRQCRRSWSARPTSRRGRWPRHRLGARRADRAGAVRSADTHRDRGPRAVARRVESAAGDERRRGEIMPTEDAFLRAVIDLGHTRVRDVMVPRSR